MLVPLNLLAFAAFSEAGAGKTGWTVGIELAAVVLFGWLALLAGGVVMPILPRRFAGGVVGLSACSLVVRFVAPQSSAALVGMGLLPVGLYVLVMASSLWQSLRVKGTAWA